MVVRKEAIESYLSHLKSQHDEKQVEAEAAMRSGAEPEVMAVYWAYSAGLMHAIRTFESALERGEF